MKKINVMLYGGFDKKTRNRAEIVSCDKTDKCSFYKKGKCLNVSQLFSYGCRFGNVSRVQGYTQRAMKRYSFDSKYKNDECYGDLKHPDEWRVERIEDTIVFNLTFAICDKRRWIGNEWIDTDTFKTRECGFSTGEYSYIPLEELTSEVLNDMLSYVPRALMGGVITKYQKEIVPNILFELSKIIPESYKNLIKDFPRYKEITPYFVGKKALIQSLPDGFTIREDKATFIKQDGYLVSDCYKSWNLPFRAEQAEIKIKITDKMVYEIKDNSEVDENTKFA